MKLKPYPKYKESGIQWIGEIPEEWSNFRLKHVVNEFISGGTPSSDNEKFWAKDDEDGINWVAIADMTGHEYITETTKKITREGLANKNLRILKKGTLIYSIFASLGKVSILKIDSTTNQAILGLIQNKKIHNRFLKYYLNSLEEPIIALSNANTQNNLNSTIVKNIDMALPLQIADQQKIASFLDSKTLEIDQTIEKDKELIELLKEKRTVLINHVVTKGLDPKVKMKDSGIDWIGKIPEGWEVWKLSHIAKLYSGGTPSKDNEGYWLNGDIPWLSSGEVNQEDITYPTTYITKEALANSSAKWMPKDTIIIALAGQGKTKGTVAHLKFKSTGNQSLAAIVPLKINPRYLFYWLKRNYYNIRGLAGEGIRDGLNLDMIKSIKSPIPPKQEQTQIVEYLDKATSKIDQTIDKIQEKITFMEEYKKSIIHHVVTGKVDVREAG